MSHHTASPPPPGAKPPGPSGPGPSGPTPSHTPPGGRHPHAHPGADDHNAWAANGILFAGTLLVLAGVMAVLEGAVGIARDSVFVATHNYAYRFGVGAWGWIHLIIGIVAVIVGLGVLRGLIWARWIGILIAGVSMLANFMFLPFQPVWSVVMIAIDVFVIWALATYRPTHTRGGLL